MDDFKNIVGVIPQDSLLPYDSAKYLKAIEPASRPDWLIERLLKSFTPADILLNPEMRDVIIQSLRKDEATALLRNLGQRPGTGNVWEKVRKALQNESIETFRSLFDYFKVDDAKLESYFSKVVEVVDEKDSAPITEISPAGQLFPHQRRALLELEELFFDPERPRYAALLHMPTGSGKTKTAARVACHYLLRYDEGLVVWLVDTRELCDQAYEELCSSWSLHGDRTLNVYRAYAGMKPDWKTVKSGILVMGLQTANCADTDDILRLGSCAPLVIFDEAHKTSATTYETTVRNLQPPSKGTSSRLLGLTATPGRSVTDEEENERLASIFGRQRVGLKVDGYDSPIEYLMDEGYMARPVYRRINTKFDIAACCRTLGIPLPKNGEMLNSRQMDKIGAVAAADLERNVLVFQETLKLIEEGHKRILLFAASVEQARRLAFMFRFYGIDAVSVDSQTSPAARREAIRHYKTSVEALPKPIIICNYNILSTGFDAPQTSAVLVARVTASLILYSQMVGRALRGEKASGNKKAVVATVIDAELPAFWDVEKAFRYWNDHWN